MSEVYSSIHKRKRGRPKGSFKKKEPTPNLTHEFNPTIDDYNFQSNFNLKKVGIPVAFTAEQALEYQKCADDPVYFVENYVKFMTDEGLKLVNLYDFQKNQIKAYHENRKVIIKTCRQVGKCQKLNTVNRLRDKKTGKIYELTAEQLYQWLSFKRKYKEIIAINSSQENQKQIEDILNSIDFPII